MVGRPCLGDEFVHFRGSILQGDNLNHEQTRFVGVFHHTISWVQVFLEFSSPMTDPCDVDLPRQIIASMPSHYPFDPFEVTPVTPKMAVHSNGICPKMPPPKISSLGIIVKLKPWFTHS